MSCIACAGLLEVLAILTDADTRECSCGRLVSVADADIPVFDMTTRRLDCEPSSTIAADWPALRYVRVRGGAYRIVSGSQFEMF